MDQNVRSMLEKTLDAFGERFSEPVEAFDNFLEFIALDSCGKLLATRERNPRWLVENREFSKKLLRTYDSRLIRSDYYDHLGDIYEQRLVLRKRVEDRRPLLLSHAQAAKLAQISVKPTTEKVSIVDVEARTGRLLMEAHKLAPQAVLYGADRDIRSVRITYTNFAVHKINGFILHADGKVHRLDPGCEDGKQNWQFANNWYSSINQLLPVRSRSKEYSK